MSRATAMEVVRPAREFFDHMGRLALLTLAILQVLPHPRRYFDAALQQAYIMGVRSLPLVLFMAVLGGAVTSQQTGAQFAGALPLWVVGSVVAKSVMTELGPVLTGLVLVGRIGASVAAELSSMRVTEQIDALYSMGRDPIQFLVVPRVVAGILVVPPLVVLAVLAGMVAGWFFGILSVDGLTTTEFLYGMRFYFEPFDLWYGVIKALAFGIAITMLSCYIGLQGKGGAEGVGRTTTTAVVACTVAVMVMDVMLVPLLKIF